MINMMMNTMEMANKGPRLILLMSVDRYYIHQPKRCFGKCSEFVKLKAGYSIKGRINEFNDYHRNHKIRNHSTTNGIPGSQLC